MRTLTSSDNPFTRGRYAFAWERIPSGAERHLDFGCHDGGLLDSLRAKGVTQRVGVDVSHHTIEAGRTRFPDLELIHIHQTVPLPFADRTFSSISILDVLEHIVLEDQRALLREFGRVLKDDGPLIVTVPRQHAFSFMDMGNLKFRWPRLHRWFYCLRYSSKAYHDRYVAAPSGLVGDISAKKRWHEHFTPAYLAELLNDAGFEVVEFDGEGLFARPLQCLLITIGRIKPLGRLVRAVERWDAKRFTSAHLFCVARKQHRPKNKASG